MENKEIRKSELNDEALEDVNGGTLGPATNYLDPKFSISECCTRCGKGISGLPHVVDGKNYCTTCWENRRFIRVDP